jgi:hypothetical protein
VYTLAKLRKRGKDLSTLTVDEVDEICFENESFWYKTDTAAMAAFTLYSSYLYGKEVDGTKGGVVTEGSDTGIKGGSTSETVSNEVAGVDW